MGTKNQKFLTSQGLSIAFLFVLLVLSFHTYGQSKTEADVLQLSKNIFRWEVESKFDSIAQLFDEQFIVVSSKGTKRGKTEYINDLKNGKPIHNSIDVQENTVSIVKNTAIVVGKG